MMGMKPADDLVVDVRTLVDENTWGICGFVLGKWKRRFIADVILGEWLLIRFNSEWTKKQAEYALNTRVRNSMQVSMWKFAFWLGLPVAEKMIEAIVDFLFTGEMEGSNGTVGKAA